MKNFLLIIPLFTTCLFSENVWASSCKLKKSNTQVYISDTHAGTGGQCTTGEDCRNGWHTMEDFRWSKDFELFVDHISKTNNNGIDLVFVGDMLEVWQQQKADTKRCGINKSRSNIGCNDKQASGRVKEIMLSHADFIAVLESFINRNAENQLIIVPGNHDASLVMPGVRNTLLNQFKEEVRNNLCVAKTGILRLTKENKNIIVEHGHQIKGDLNRYQDAADNEIVTCVDKNEKPISCESKDSYIFRTWGENFVQKYFDGHERTYSIIDNYSFEPSGLPDGVKRGLQSSTLKESSSAITGLLSFLFTEQTFKQFSGLLGSNKGLEYTGFCEPETEPRPGYGCFSREVFNKASSTSPVFNRLPDDMSSHLTLLTQSLGINGSNGWMVANLYKINKDINIYLDEIFSSICLYWANVPNSTENSTFPEHCKLISTAPPLNEVASKLKFSFFKNILERPNERLWAHIKSRINSIENDTIFIYGHTHKATSGEDKNTGLYFFNTGAWQRVATSSKIKSILADCPLRDSNNAPLGEDECFKKITPGELPACYSYVIHKQGDDLPTLNWWFLSEDKTWKSTSHISRPDKCR